MNKEQIDFLIKHNKGLAPTNNKFFDENGYLIIKNIFDFEKLEDKIPNLRGQLNYYEDSYSQFYWIPEESQVNGSVSRYSYPKYKEAHYIIKKELEKNIEKKLHETYYYDRFYFPGQELTKHVDRDACEISVSVHIGSNINTPWYFELTDVSGKNIKINLNPGDGIVYKGCEICHWRSPMPGKKINRIRKFIGMKEFYYHQIFFHYVLSDGHRVHCAFDAAK